MSTRPVANLPRYLTQGEARPPASLSLEQLAAAHWPSASVEGYLSLAPDRQRRDVDCRWSRVAFLL